MTRNERKRIGTIVIPFTRTGTGKDEVRVLWPPPPNTARHEKSARHMDRRRRSAELRAHARLRAEMSKYGIEGGDGSPRPRPAVVP